MTYNIPYISERIVDDSITAVAVYEGHITGDIADKKMFRRFDGEPSQLVEKLEKFSKQSFGRFTFVLREKSRTGWDNAQIVLVDNLKKDEHGHAHEHSGQIDLYTAIETAKKELRAEYEAREKDRKIQELEEKLERHNEPGSKLAELLDVVIEKVQGGNYTPAPVMQGTDSQNSNTDTMDQPDQEVLEKSLAELIDMFGAKGVVLLVHKLKTDKMAFNFVQQTLQKMQS